jgi:hypothetical protein
VQITVGKMRKYSITLVFSSRSYSSQVSTIIAFSDCCLQSSQIWHRCQNFHFEVFLADSRMAARHGVHQNNMVFILYPWLLFSQGGLMYLHRCILFVSLQQWCVYADSCVCRFCYLLVNLLLWSKVLSIFWSRFSPRRISCFHLDPNRELSVLPSRLAPSMKWLICHP